MLRQALMQLSQQKRLQELTVRNPLARSMARRFVAGETLDEALTAVRGINAQGMTATLDHLGENVTTRTEAAEAARAYCLMLQRIRETGANCNVSLKLTHMGLDLGREVALDNVGSILQEAALGNNFVRIDMESSEYVERTLDLFFELYGAFGNVGIVLQAYLYRTPADLERVLDVGARVRLVKGAYLEPPAVAYPDKADVDRAFVRLMEILLARGNYPAIATHDENMIAATERYARIYGIACERFEFQMLYGIRRDLQARLVQDGYNMRIYVPYGTEWYPYLMRRMAERPANLMFVAGNIAREAIPGRG